MSRQMFHATFLLCRHRKDAGTDNDLPHKHRGSEPRVGLRLRRNIAD